MCPSVVLLVGLLVHWFVRNAFVTAGKNKLTNDLFCVYKLIVSNILQMHKKEIEKENLNACLKVNNLKAVVNGGI